LLTTPDDGRDITVRRVLGKGKFDGIVVVRVGPKLRGLIERLDRWTRWPRRENFDSVNHDQVDIPVSALNTQTELRSCGNEGDEAPQAFYYVSGREEQEGRSKARSTGRGASQQFRCWTRCLLGKAGARDDRGEPRYRRDKIEGGRTSSKRGNNIERRGTSSIFRLLYMVERRESSP
jgi:hypothetical protein